MSLKPIVNARFILKKFPGKGGWTYADLPPIAAASNLPFGWIVVNGFIDDYELKKHKLMPKGDGTVFLSVNAQIRRRIGKEAGDEVHVRLWQDTTPLIIPQELLDCFADAPKKAYQNFINFSESEQKVFIDWIYSAKTEEKKAERILDLLHKAERNKRFYS